MIIEKNKVVSINYILSDDNNDIVETTKQQGPMIYLHGANNILPVLENALEGKSPNSRVRTTVSPKEGYGEYIEEMVQSIPLSGFPNADKVKVGVQFELDTDDGTKIATITKVDEDAFTLDMNHPLAGQTLHFDIEVAAIREASAEEIQNGQIHTHGCGCGGSHEEHTCGCDQDEKKECGCGHSH